MPLPQLSHADTTESTVNGKDDRGGHSKTHWSVKTHHFTILESNSLLSQAGTPLAKKLVEFFHFALSVA
jgi:hypothetical protein